MTPKERSQEMKLPATRRHENSPNRSELASQNESDTELIVQSSGDDTFPKLVDASNLFVQHTLTKVSTRLNSELHRLCLNNGLFSLKKFTEEPLKRLSITAI